MAITFFPTKPLYEINAIESHGCLDDNGNVEQVPDDRSQYFSVYLRYKHNEHGFGGLDCIADCDQKAEAEELAGFLTTLLKLEV